METLGIFTSAARVLRLIYGDHLKGKSIADIGCLEGGYTTEFARLGMDALGIEVRQSNLQNCMVVKDRTYLPES